MITLQEIDQEIANHNQLIESDKIFFFLTRILHQQTSTSFFLLSHSFSTDKKKQIHTYLFTYKLTLKIEKFKK